MDNEDVYNPDLDPLIQPALSVSDLSQIAFDRNITDIEIIPDEPSHEWWCYYYQKGDAAAQQDDWATALDLYKQARTAGHRAYASSEYMPFLQAAAHQDEWDLAADISLDASFLTNSTAQICETWQALQEEVTIPENLLTYLVDRFQCTNLE
ncbi:hypothetical protein EG832_14160 [bacterium]|nr:hypothetical protein [bacterium]